MLVARGLFGSVPEDIHRLCPEAKGVMWVGTSAGLYRINAGLNGFSRFNGHNSEFAGNMMVNGLLEDDEKAL